MTPAAAQHIRRVWIALALVVGVAWVVTQLAAVYSESINWDELALLNRATRSLASGQLEGGGRPGLAVVLLMPFVHGCTSTMSSVHGARLLWVAFDVALLAGLFVFLLRAVREPRLRWYGATLGVALLALVPVVLRWSVQVRTDQPAIAFTLWAGVSLLASREHPRLAVAAGALAAIGFLFSQKAIYVIGLVGAVALGDLFRDASGEVRRELKRVAFAVAGAVAVLVAYRVLLPLFFAPPRTTGVGTQLDIFANYRKLFGYRLYSSMLPTLYPHLVALGAIAIALFRADRRGQAERRQVLVALSIATLGVVVGWFHAGAFPYFWMTLGLFPATAIALGVPALAKTFGRAAPLFLAAFSAWLLCIALPYRREVLHDTQAIQRDSFAFIENVLPATARGFSPDGGLFCRADPEPLPVYFREHAEALGIGADAAARQAAFLAIFKQRPITFILETFLLDPFPEPIKAFWREHYVRHTANVLVPGRILKGRAGTHIDLDAIVPGTYTWHGTTSVTVDGSQLSPGASTTLAAGPHEIVLDAATTAAPLMLDLPRPPSPAPATRPFHAAGPIVEIIGARQQW